MDEKQKEFVFEIYVAIDALKGRIKDLEEESSALRRTLNDLSYDVRDLERSSK